MGYPTTVNDNGDDSVAGDESCTRTWYARNAAKGLLSLTSRVQMLGIGCSVTPTLPTTLATTGDVISDTATAYDGQAWSQAAVPSIGNPTWMARAKSYSSSTPAWSVVTTATYDALGRPTVQNDASGNTTTIAYTPSGAGVPSSLASTNALGHLTTTSFDARTGMPIAVTDANGNITETSYDALSRLTDVWLPTSSRGGGAVADFSYRYRLSQTLGDPSSIATTSRANNFKTGYSFYDGLAREIQSQTPSAVGGRLITDTVFDEHGNTASARSGIWNSSAPSTTYFGTADGAAPTETRTAYDGADRAVTSSFVSLGVVKWSTTTSYTGDSTASTSPVGGTGSRVVTDALDRVTKRLQYASTGVTGTALTTTFDYDNGRLATVTAPDTTDWTYGYDLFGRPRYTSDPDSGNSTTYYTNLDQPSYSSDARGRAVITAYDALGRVSGTWDGVQDDAHLLTTNIYDTVEKGQLTASSTYVGGAAGQAFSRTITAYDQEYHPTTWKLTLPSSNEFVTAGVPATLNYATDYSEGLPTKFSEPAAAGMPAESTFLGYDTYRNLTKTSSVLGNYLRSLTYTEFGEPQLYTLAKSDTATNVTQISQTYETGTRRLQRSSTTDNLHAWMTSDLNYAYDQGGNVTSIVDNATLGGSGKSDRQCYRYDGYARLQVAFTPAAAACTTLPAVFADLGGAAPYWQDFSYNTNGTRSKLVDHGSSGDSTVTYTYGGAGKPAHSVASTSTVSAAGTKVATYGYNASGATTSRPGANGQQTIDWDARNRLSQVTQAEGAGTSDTDFIYGPDGTLLMRRSLSPNGESILYLGNTEVRLTKSNGVTQPLSSRRYYTAGASTIAVRTATNGVSGTSLSYLMSDRHETASLALDATSLAIKKRYTKPFGEPRGAGGSWVDDKGFIGKPFDASTGLTHIGAREYDSLIGRFLSVDPVLDTANPQTLNGYSYTGGNPSTFSDPTGLLVTSGTGGASASDFVTANKEARKRASSGVTQSGGVRVSAPSSPARQSSTPRRAGTPVGPPGTVGHDYVWDDQGHMISVSSPVAWQLLRQESADRCASAGIPDCGATSTDPYWDQVVQQMVDDTFQGILAWAGMRAYKGSGRPGVAVAEPAMPKLTGTILDSFEDGAYSVERFRAGTVFYRAENKTQGVGSFAGFEKPATSVDAEKMFNLEMWGNHAEVVRTYKLTQDLPMYVGRVAGGTTDQALLPRGVLPGNAFTLVKTEPLK